MPYRASGVLVFKQLGEVGRDGALCRLGTSRNQIGRFPNQCEDRPRRICPRDLEGRLVGLLKG